MLNSCTVIPVHPKDFGYAVEAYDSYKENVGHDLFFVFSSQQEFMDFKQHRPIDRCIVYEGPNTSNLITLKKFYAINQLKDHFEYIGVFDSETLFVKPMSIDTVYKTIVDSRIFKSNRRHSTNHLREVASLMGYGSHEGLLQETDNFSQYWWFNEICVYSSSYFKEFYAWFLAHPNHDLMMRNFACFDYLLYSVWLICNRGFRLKKLMQNYSFVGAAIETNFDDNEVSNIFQSYQDRNNNHADIPHIKIQIMRDRDLDHCRNEGGRIKYES